MNSYLYLYSFHQIICCLCSFPLITRSFCLKNPRPYASSKSPRHWCVSATRAPSCSLSLNLMLDTLLERATCVSPKRFEAGVPSPPPCSPWTLHPSPLLRLMPRLVEEVASFYLEVHKALHRKSGKFVAPYLRCACRSCSGLLIYVIMFYDPKNQKLHYRYDTVKFPVFVDGRLTMWTMYRCVYEYMINQAVGEALELTCFRPYSNLRFIEERLTMGAYHDTRSCLSTLQCR